MRFPLSNTILFFFLIILVFSCNQASERKKEFSDHKKTLEIIRLDIPRNFPDMPIPEDNQLTAERIEMGEKLFFDVLLSKDSSLSCSSCHQPELAFADSLAVSPGIGGKKGFRNAPSLINVGYRPSFMLDGGVTTLEIQVIHPLTDTNEMGLGINEAVLRLKNHPYYSKQSHKAYHRNLDAYVITRALSAYERTLIQSSRYDDYSNGDTNALSAAEKRGMDLFYSTELNCGSCHSGILFTDFSYQNNGSKKNYIGDSGRERITHEAADVGKFRVPSLRNLALTAPYMHDGSYSNLEEVIRNYEVGGQKHPNKSKNVKPFRLTHRQRQDLIQFLQCL